MNRKILVVEDEDGLRDILKIVLTDEEYQVETACNGQEAWDLIQSNTYDLLATDLFMPVMDGAELIHKCRKNYPKLKIVLFSGGGRELQATHGDDFVRLNDEEIAVDMFLSKPCNLNELLNIVEKLLKE